MSAQDTRLTRGVYRCFTISHPGAEQRVPCPVCLQDCYPFVKPFTHGRVFQRCGCGEVALQRPPLDAPPVLRQMPEATQAERDAAILAAVPATDPVDVAFVATRVGRSGEAVKRDLLRLTRAGHVERERRAAGLQAASWLYRRAA